MSYRILYCGKFKPLTHSDVWISRGMIRQGWTVHNLDVRQKNVTEKARALLKSFKPTHIFMGKARSIDIKFLEEVKKQGVKVAVWYGDIRTTPPGWTIDLAKASNLFLLTSVGQLDLFRKRGVKRAEFWPLAAAPDMHAPVSPTKAQMKKYGCDIAFFGGNYGHKFPDGDLRRKVLKVLSKSFRVKVYGGGWHSCTSCGSKYTVMKPVYLREQAIALNCAKLALGINNFNSVYMYQSHRTWTHMSCGACLLNKQVPGLEKMFKHKVNQVIWKDIPELMVLAKYYLEHEKERKQIGKQARTFILQGHTFEHRVVRLEELFKGL